MSPPMDPNVVEKCSPGPWKWVDYRDMNGTWQLTDAEGESIMRIKEVGPNNTFTFMGPDCPDSRLIAAAPEMLESLRWAMDILDRRAHAVEGYWADKARALTDRFDGEVVAK